MPRRPLKNWSSDRRHLRRNWRTRSQTVDDVLLFEVAAAATFAAFPPSDPPTPAPVSAALVTAFARDGHGGAGGGRCRVGRRDEAVDDEIRDRRSAAGDHVVTDGRLVGAVAAGGDVVEIAAGEAEDRLIGVGEGRLSGRRPALIGQSDQSRPLRRAGAGAADVVPIAAIAHVEAGVRIGIVGHIRIALLAGALHARQVARFGFVGAISAAAAAPSRFAAVAAGCGQLQRGAADGQNVVRRWPANWRPRRYRPTRRRTSPECVRRAW